MKINFALTALFSVVFSVNTIFADRLEMNTMDSLSSKISALNSKIDTLIFILESSVNRIERKLNESIEKREKLEAGLAEDKKRAFLIQMAQPSSLNSSPSESKKAIFDEFTKSLKDCESKINSYDESLRFEENLGFWSRSDNRIREFKEKIAKLQEERLTLLALMRGL